METNALIPVQLFCMHHHTEVSFIRSLEQYGLVELVTVEETTYIHEDSISELEQYLRLHHELDINPEGIDAISHLLKKIQQMQQDIRQLQNRLSGYEMQ